MPVIYHTFDPAKNTDFKLQPHISISPEPEESMATFQINENPTALKGKVAIVTGIPLTCELTF